MSLILMEVWCVIRHFFFIASMPPERLDYMPEECQTAIVKGEPYLKLKHFTKEHRIIFLSSKYFSVYIVHVDILKSTHSMVK